MRRLILATASILIFVACTKKSETSAPSSGWTDAQISEVSEWHFKDVSSKAQSMATRGDNAKKEFSRCWTLKMAKEYSYPEYKKSWKELDDYVRTNNVVITTLNESIALGQKYPFHQRMNDFVVECSNELKI